jgi:polar amino acid transport system ATP-binding protein
MSAPRWRRAASRRSTEIGFVFQQFDLYRHKTALANVTLAPIHVREIPPVEAATAGRELLAKVGLADKFNAYPAELSEDSSSAWRSPTQPRP